jgi:hypothetical protein
MAGNTNFDALLTTTLHNYVSKKLEDNIFAQCPTLNALKAKAGVTTKGGDKLLMPLMYAKNSTVKTMTPYEVFDMTPQEGISAAEYLWANLGGTVVMDNFTLDVENAGASKVIDLLEAKINQLEMSMVDLVNTQLWSTARTSAYQLWSLYDALAVGSTDDLFIDPTYTGDGTGFGRISIASSANTWWRPARYYDDGTAGPSTAAGALPTADDGLSIMNLNHIYNVCSNGSDTPNLIIMPMQLYEKFESLLIATNRTGPDSALYDAGIEHLRLKNASVIFDQAMTGATTLNEVFFLNTRYLKFVQCEGRTMKSTPFVTPADQDVRSSKIIWSGQLACSNRSRQGVWVDVDVV